ncbi:NDR1/HIN1-like protein 13 [Bidens hawaiensis]|uniref:NDR1/HIN1-like protein 13 n=1 Tax=Bidens hawaiensis TaxID=980011 RepID=UPI004049276B
MAEKIHPAGKPAGAPAPATNLTFPATKPLLHNTTRPVYRPQPRRTHRRSFCCSICLCLTVTIIILFLIAAVAGGVTYVIYRPHRPTFSITSLHVTQFNLTSSNKLTTKFNLTALARNPNKKILLYYDPVIISFKSHGVNVGNGNIPAFVSPKKNTTALRTVVALTGQTVGGDDNGVKLKSEIKSKKSVELKTQMDTKVKVKIGSLKTKKLTIRVTCDGIKVPVGKTAAATVGSGGVKCKVDVRIKIWKWTV